MILAASIPPESGTGASRYIGILLLIAVSLLAAELLRRKHALPSFLRVLTYTYSEFVLLGLAIGPLGLGLLDRRLLREFDPLLHLSLGAIGLLYGLQFRFAHIRRFLPAMFGVTFFQAAFTFLLCYMTLFVLALLLGAHPIDAAFLAATLGTIASVSAPQPIAHTIREQQVRGENAHLLQFITALDGLFGVCALALVMAARTDYAVVAVAWLDVAAAVVVAILVGLICGVAFHWLTEGPTSPQERVLYMLGLVTFGSGVAATLHLSPLFVNVVFGLTVANLSYRVEETSRQLGRLERPLFIVLLILAGARWELSGRWLGPLMAGYLLCRLLGKWAGAWLGVRVFPLYFQPVGRLGLALMGQGGIALALLVSLSLVERGPLMGVIETVVILSIVVSELVTPPLVRHVLTHGREARGER